MPAAPAITQPNRGVSAHHGCRPGAPATGTLGVADGGPVVAPGVVTVERFATALGIEPAVLTVDEVRAEMRLVRSVQAVAAARLLSLDERMRNIAENAESPYPVDPQRELCRQGGMRRSEARSLSSQTAARDAAPQLGRLLAEGATTAAHLDAMGQALHLAGDGRDTLLSRSDEIARRAVTTTADEFSAFVKRLARDAQPDEGLSILEEQRRNTYCKLWSDRSGMMRMSGAFDPVLGAAIAGHLDHQVESMFHSGDKDRRDAGGLVIAPGIDPNDHRRALALHTMVCGRKGSTASNESGDARPDARSTRAEVIVHVDLQTLTSGRHADGVCRTSHGADIPPDTARRIACDADIIPVVLDGRSVPLDVGRAKRLATVHQRRALEAVHDTCAMPDCDVGITRCVIHHLHPWEQGGVTDLDNMVPLCNAHHHAVHEGGWTISLDPADRTITAAPPLGRRSSDPHPPSRAVSRSTQRRRR